MSSSDNIVKQLFIRSIVIKRDSINEEYSVESISCPVLELKDKKRNIGYVWNLDINTHTFSSGVLLQFYLTLKNTIVSPIEAEIELKQVENGMHTSISKFGRFSQFSNIQSNRKEFIGSRKISLFRHSTVKLMKFYFVVTLRYPDDSKLSSEILKSFQHDYRSLLSNDALSDFTVTVNSKSYAVHSQVMAARSAYFDAMFRCDTKEKANRSVVLVGIDTKVFEQLLNFIYTGNVADISDDCIIKQLFIAADKYQINSLKTFCETRVYREIKCENLFEVLVFADTYYLSNLKTRAIDHFVRHFAKLHKTDDYRNFLKLYPNLAIDVLDEAMNLRCNSSEYVLKRKLKVI